MAIRVHRAFPSVRCRRLRRFLWPALTSRLTGIPCQKMIVLWMAVRVIRTSTSLARPASPEPSLKKPFRGFLAGDDGAARYMRLKRETSPSDTPLIGPPRWLPEIDRSLLSCDAKNTKRCASCAPSSWRCMTTGFVGRRVRMALGEITSRRTTTNRYRAFLTSMTATSRRRAANS